MNVHTFPKLAWFEQVHLGCREDKGTTWKMLCSSFSYRGFCNEPQETTLTSLDPSFFLVWPPVHMIWMSNCKTLEEIIVLAELMLLLMWLATTFWLATNTVTCGPKIWCGEKIAQTIWSRKNRLKHFLDVRKIGHRMLQCKIWEPQGPPQDAALQTG